MNKLGKVRVIVSLSLLFSCICATAASQGGYPCEPFIQGQNQYGEKWEIYYSPFGHYQTSAEVNGISTTKEAIKFFNRLKGTTSSPFTKGQDLVIADFRERGLIFAQQQMRYHESNPSDHHFWQQVVYMYTCYKEAGWPKDTPYRRCSLNPPGKLGGMDGGCTVI